jgi:hypothetical protein
MALVMAVAGLAFLAFGVSNALDGRWRDARESGIPGVICLVGAGLLGSRALGRRR